MIKKLVLLVVFEDQIVLVLYSPGSHIYRGESHSASGFGMFDCEALYDNNNKALYDYFMKGSTQFIKFSI